MTSSTRYVTVTSRSVTSSGGGRTASTIWRNPNPTARWRRLAANPRADRFALWCRLVVTISGGCHTTVANRATRILTTVATVTMTTLTGTHRGSTMTVTMTTRDTRRTNR